MMNKVIVKEADMIFEIHVDEKHDFKKSVDEFEGVIDKISGCTFNGYDHSVFDGERRISIFINITYPDSQRFMDFVKDIIKDCFKGRD